MPPLLPELSSEDEASLELWLELIIGAADLSAARGKRLSGRLFDLSFL
jgi:hypothetical protein